jgi:hypothetical protein
LTGGRIYSCETSVLARLIDAVHTAVYVQVLGVVASVPLS